MERFLVSVLIGLGYETQGIKGRFIGSDRRRISHGKSLSGIINGSLLVPLFERALFYSKNPVYRNNNPFFSSLFHQFCSLFRVNNDLDLACELAWDDEKDIGPMS